jgi:hypothetical protein
MTKLADVVSKAAPLVGSILNSVLPGSSLIVQGIGALFGLGANASQDDIANAIAANPEAYLQLQKFELEHKYDLENIMAQDRANARNMAIETTKATGKRDWIPAYLVIFLTFFAIYIFTVIVFFHQDPDDRGIVEYIAGYIFGLIGNVGALYFGISHFIKKKMQEGDSEIDLPPPAQTR